MGRGYVYYIQQGAHGPIKIGVSYGPYGRLRQLQASHADELHMLGTYATDEPYGMEAAIHERLAGHRLRGEWFAPHADVLALIEAHLDPPRAEQRPRPEPVFVSPEARYQAMARRLRALCDTPKEAA